jgi:hypothetical protein
LKTDYNIVVVADRYGNFAGHAIYESIKRGYGNAKRDIVSYRASFSGEPNLVFYWVNHNDPLILSKVFRMDFDEIHIAGPEIDEDMVDVFETVRAEMRRKKAGAVKVVLSERKNTQK